MCISKNICGNNDAPWSMYVCMFYISQIQDIYMYGSRKQLETCIMFFLFWDNLDLSGGIQFPLH